MRAWTRQSPRDPEAERSQPTHLEDAEVSKAWELHGYGKGREDSRATPRFPVMIIGWMMVRYGKRFMEEKNNIAR